MVGSYFFLLLGIIPSLSSNIYLIINPLLAPGLSESCWLCSHHNPLGYFVRSDCRLSKAVLILSSGSYLERKIIFYRYLANLTFILAEL